MKPEVRTFLRERCKEDLFFLSKEILGYSKMTESLHLPICQLVQNTDYKTMIIIPRRFYKTTIVSICDTVHRVIKCLPDEPTSHPKIGITQLLTTLTADNVVPWISKVQEHVELNRSLQEIFPDLEPDPGWWKDDSIRFKSQSIPEMVSGHVDGIGIGGRATGRGYGVVKFDDVLDYEDVKTPARRAATAHYHAKMQPLCANGIELLVGTFYHYNDLYNRKLKDPEYKTLVLGCWGPDGHSIFPEEYPDAKLLRIKRGMETGEEGELSGSYIFACQMENNPGTEQNAEFKPEWLGNYYHVLPKKTAMEVLAAVDPSPGLKDGDPSGIVVVGITADEDWYILHSESFRYTSEQLAHRIANLHRSFHPHKWIIESNGTQHFVKQGIQNVMRDLKMYLPVEWGPSETYLGKDTRIGQLRAQFEFHKVYFRPADNALKQELRYWRHWKHDDVADALSYIWYARRKKMSKIETKVVQKSYKPTIKELVESGAPTSQEQVAWL